MRFVVSWICAGLLVLLAVQGFARDNRTEEMLRVPEAQSRDAVPGMVVIKFKHAMHFGESAAATGIASLDAIFDHLSVREMRQLLPARAMQRGLANPVDIESIYNLSYHSEIAPQAAAALLSADPNIEYAEPKHIFKLFDTPNDPLYSSMEQFAQVLAPQAWDVIKGA